MGIISRLFTYALVLALVAALGLWVVGGYKAENSGSIEIKATPEQIFQVLSDPDERQKWLLNATRVEMKSKPPLGPKTTYVTQQLVEGKDQPSEDSVQQIKEPEWLSIRMETAASTLITMFEISRVGDQSRLNYKASQVPNNLYRLLAPFKKLDLQGRIDEELVKIKRQAEDLAAKAPPEAKPAEPTDPPATDSGSGDKSPEGGEAKTADPETAPETGTKPEAEKKDGV